MRIVFLFLLVAAALGQDAMPNIKSIRVYGSDEVKVHLRWKEPIAGHHCDIHVLPFDGHFSVAVTAHDPASHALIEVFYWADRALASGAKPTRLLLHKAEFVPIPESEVAVMSDPFMVNPEDVAMIKVRLVTESWLTEFVEEGSAKELHR